MEPHVVAICIAAQRGQPQLDEVYHLLKALAHELDEAGSAQGLANQLHADLGDVAALQVLVGLNKTVSLLFSTLYADLLIARSHDPLIHQTHKAHP
jgi:hypothetical protein